MNVKEIGKILAQNYMMNPKVVNLNLPTRNHGF